MPPEAISRSSTYFPKIWGNTRFTYRTALLGIWLGTGCTTPPPELVPRTIRAHWMPGCTPDTTTGKLDLDALGDFDPSPQTHVVVGVADPDKTVGIPDSTRSLVLDADTAVGRFRGVGAVPESDSITVSLWPVANACPLHAVTDTRAYPQDLDGVAIGYSASASVVLVVGGSTSPNSALVIDIATGTAAEVDPAVGPRTDRIGATVTEFGDKLLVAGGLDGNGAANHTADVFDPVLGRFEKQRIDLEGNRANHGAVVLASGETLLVGGSDTETSALVGLESISPETGTYRVAGLKRLKDGRTNPRVVRLTDDRVLVAGGTASDGTPVDTLEWFSPDGSEREPQSPSLSTPPAPPVADRAVVAMPGGSALAVGGCELATASDCVPCTTSAVDGCASKDVYWITRDGSIEPLPALDVATYPALLVAGAEGRPWLVASSQGGRRFLQFDPWLGRFMPPEAAPAAPLAGFELADDAGNTGFQSRIVGADPGLAIWLTKNTAELPSIFGFRHGTRGPYDAAVVPLLLASRDGVALDRRNDGDAGGLDTDGYAVLTDGGDTLVVTDTTYANVELTIDAGDGPPPGVVLFASHGGTAEREWTYGSEQPSATQRSCPWPAAPQGKRPAPRLRRVDGQVTLTQGGKERNCKGPEGRVSVWFRSPGGEVRIRSIDVKRSL
jgi:hypothetical protein